MLIVEYRIPLPLTVEEYRIAQLYMIAKKSNEESEGSGSGVEIIVNEPYSTGPGGSGQYTQKKYHIGRRLPGWLKSILPASALIVGEEAWNAYPYTKTIYTCPFVDKFSILVETRYFNDDGSQDNVFDLNNEELGARIVDVIDIVKDGTPGVDYQKSEDPTVYVSEKTGRGPLSENWVQEHWDAFRSDPKGPKSIMCAYKLCKVEFKYWGMQTRIEKFINDIALRRTMVGAHVQAWTWQDEWHGLNMDDIREMEREVQRKLAEKMARVESQEKESDQDEDEFFDAD